MKVSYIAVLSAILVGGCQKEHSQPMPAAQPAYSASGVSTLVPSAPSLPASVPVSFSKTGAYELADVLRWALPDSGGTAFTTPGLQDYNRFKGVVQDIQLSQEPRSRYVGAVTLMVDGRQMQPENLVDNYRTGVKIFGVEAGAQGISFATGVLPTVQAGPAYLRKQGLDVVPLSCFSVGKTPTNAEALYLVRAPGKAPTYVTYRVSTGSAGVSIDYTVRYGGMDWQDVPGAVEPQFDGTVQPFGHCPYKEMQ